MLAYINIQNFAIIEAIELDFQPGMTVLTGETGAGKSIIIDTLEFVLGARADSSVIRFGADRCEITAAFDITTLPKISHWLIEQEFDSENECIIKRSMNTDGRSKSSINGNPCPQLLVRELGALLVDIYGQHEHHELLKLEKQRDLLDAFANNQKLCNDVKTYYNEWLQAKSFLANASALTEDCTTKVEYTNHLICELEELSLENDEFENLQQELRLLNLAVELTQDCNKIISSMSDNDVSVLAELNTAKNCIEKYKNIDIKFTPIIDFFNNAIIQTQEATDEIRRYLDKIDFSETRLNQIETRLVCIHNLARKHHVKPDGLPKILSQLHEQLSDLQRADEQKQKYQEAVNKVAELYLKSATELSQQRQEAAQKLNRLVTTKMQSLGMENGEFAIKFKPTPDYAFSVNGLEQVEFDVATNPGQPLIPLNKIVSGGELSRISLAIQVIIATKDITPVLIFDEVDVGIGGKTAEIVGKILKELSKQAQVICVTHLPQVAVHGNSHMLVQKKTLHKIVNIKIAALTQSERVSEIARMLGGANITQQTLAHAQEMLQMAE
jgi:DNA repair protein RecN (Recombination protein N)